ncbi:uncharacterized [Tachysurus ichikawai]
MTNIKQGSSLLRRPSDRSETEPPRVTFVFPQSFLQKQLIHDAPPALGLLAACLALCQPSLALCQSTVKLIIE